MNDKLYLENYLLVLKSTVEVYVHGTLESSNADVKHTLQDCLNEILMSQEDTYNEMTNMGIYKVKNIKSSAISDSLKKLNSN